MLDQEFATAVAGDIEKLAADDVATPVALALRRTEVYAGRCLLMPAHNPEHVAAIVAEMTGCDLFELVEVAMAYVMARIDETKQEDPATADALVSLDRFIGEVQHRADSATLLDFAKIFFALVTIRSHLERNVLAGPDQRLDGIAEWDYKSTAELTFQHLRDLLLPEECGWLFRDSVPGLMEKINNNQFFSLGIV